MIIKIAGLLIIIGILILSFIKKPMVTISVLILIVVGGLVFRLTWSFLPLSIGTRHLINSMVSPKNLYQPIILDKFLFYEKGFTKTYHLKPTYLDIYEIGFSVGQEGITSKYKFKGKLKVEFFWKDKFLFDDVITSWKSAGYVQNDMAHFKNISLYEFDIPLQKKYTKDISVKITVLESDKDLGTFGNLIELYIAVTTSP